MQLRRAWEKADDLYDDIRDTRWHLNHSDQFSIEKRNDISQHELTSDFPVDQRQAIL
jgi:hypothetical protein